MRVAFLHIPKTAGQSVHGSIERLFSDHEVCPARVNEQLYKYSINQLRDFNLFSGHLDWSAIKLSGAFDFSFTVMRDPLDRILSMYFFMRGVAKTKAQEGDILPPGLNALAHGTPRDYFLIEDKGTHTHLQNYYNNIYSYYFATGSFEGYRLLLGSCENQIDTLPAIALGNLRLLTKIYSLRSINQLHTDLAKIFQHDVPEVGSANVNRNVPTSRHDRISIMNDLSPNWDWKEYFESLTLLDYRLMGLLDEEGLIIA